MKFKFKHLFIVIFLMIIVLMLKRRENQNDKEQHDERKTYQLMTENITHLNKQDNKQADNFNLEKVSMTKQTDSKTGIDVKYLDFGTSDDPEDIYQERRNRMLNACSVNGSKYHGKLAPHMVKHRIIIGEKQHLAYCTIQKTGSTFWKRVSGESKAKSPYDPSVPSLAKFRNLWHLPPPAADIFMKKSLKFIFVREPYSRLFSGYVDKLFSPNAFYWKQTGAFGMKIAQVRKYPTSTDLYCGHDLTFSEFVKTVLYAEKHNIKRNGHFTPEYEHCDPCLYKYDIIAKMETLSQDTFYLLDKMGKTDLRKSLEKDFRGQNMNDTVRDQVRMLYAFRPQYKPCGVSFYEAQKRMWKKFQIRGIISTNSKLPIRRSQSETVTPYQFEGMVYRAIGDAADKNVAKRNKEEALIEAYSTIDKRDKDILSELFTPDCELFGYDCRPDRLFNIEKRITPWYLNINTA